MKQIARRALLIHARVAMTAAKVAWPWADTAPDAQSLTEAARGRLAGPKDNNARRGENDV